MRYLSRPPVLGYANYEIPFELRTDASGQGLGAVSYQRQDKELWVIAYASRGLTKIEKTALKWAGCEKFHGYLYGHDFTVYTENKPLTYVLTSTKLDATGHRRLAALATYHFDILYRPGKCRC